MVRASWELEYGLGLSAGLVRLSDCYFSPLGLIDTESESLLKAIMATKSAGAVALA